MEEKILNNLEWTLEEFKTSPIPQEYVDFQAAKIEGAIGLAYTIGAITLNQHNEFYRELLNAKYNKMY